MFILSNDLSLLNYSCCSVFGKVRRFYNVCLTHLEPATIGRSHIFFSSGGFFLGWYFYEWDKYKFRNRNTEQGDNPDEDV